MTGSLRKDLDRTAALLDVVISTIGPKPGKAAVLSRLISVEDLDNSGFRVLKERTYRTGPGRSATPEIKRARASGSVTAIRYFRSAIAGRTVWVSITPFASNEDAETYLPSLYDHLLRLPFGRYKTLEVQRIDPLEFNVQPTVAYQERYEGPRGPGVSRMIGGVAGLYEYVLYFSTTTEEWSWEEILDISSVQRRKLVIAND